MTPSWPQLVGWMQTAQVRTARGHWRTVVDGDEQTGTFVLRYPHELAARDARGRRAEGPEFLLPRHVFERGDDYHRAAGAITAVQHDGRAAWQVELEPPARKSGLLTLVVDEQTGLILRQGNEEHGVLREVLDLELDVEVADALLEVAEDDAEDDAEDQVSRLYDLVVERPPPTPRWFPWRRSWVELPDCRSVESVGAEASVGRAPLGSPAPVSEWALQDDVVRLDHGGWSWAVAGQPMSAQEARRVVEQVVEQPD